MKRFALLLFFLAFMFVARSQNQDLILTTTGFKIYCKIVKEDSLSLFYNIANHPSTLEIKRTNVMDYYVNLIKHKENKKPAYNEAGLPVEPFTKDLLLLAVSAGVTNPVSDFANKDVYYEKAGLAKTGFLLQASAVLKLSKNIGFSAAYQHQENWVAKELINQQVVAINNGIPFTTKAGNWVVSGVFGGLYLETAIQNVKGLSLYLNASVGMPRYKSPEIISELAVPGYYFSVKQSSGKAKGFAYVLGPGVFYKFNQETGLNLSVNYLAGEGSFSNILIINSTGARETIDFSQKFTTLNVQLSLVLCVPK